MRVSRHRVQPRSFNVAPNCVIHHHSNVCSDLCVTCPGDGIRGLLGRAQVAARFHSHEHLPISGKLTKVIDAFDAFGHVLMMSSACTIDVPDMH